MGNKNNPTQFGQMALTDRVAIEVGIAKKQTFEKIGKTIGRSPVTVAREIKANRTKLPPEYPFGNDCKLARHCEKKHMCGADPEACDEKCKKCRGFNCHENCVLYESVECHQTDRPPYVCNYKLLNRNVNTLLEVSIWQEFILQCGNESPSWPGFP